MDEPPPPPTDALLLQTYDWQRNDSAAEMSSKPAAQIEVPPRCWPTKWVVMIRRYFERLTKNFGTGFTVMLFSAYFGCKGALYTFVLLAMLPYFKAINVDIEKYQVFSIVALTPFSMKGLIGTISDSIPIFGYHKKYYIFGSSLVGSAAFCCLAAIPLPEEYAWVAALLFFLTQMQVTSARDSVDSFAVG